MSARQRKSRKGGGLLQQSVPVEEIHKTAPDTTSKRGSSNDMKVFLQRQPVWIILAVASGACAAINGVFAKLTTTSLTATFSAHLATLLGFEADNKYVNLLLRSTFFGLNILFNAIMWGLFTAALTRGSSTTRVSIVNVSANFFLTAMMGWAVFDEKLPLQWWLGAVLLACGNVVIGRREEDEKKPAESPTTLGADDEAVSDLIELDEGGKENEHATKQGTYIDNPI